MRDLSGATVAVIGIGCRLPGSNSASELFRHLLNRRDEITNIPRRKVLLHRAAQEGAIPAWGAFLEDEQTFDNDFFQFSIREAQNTDPQLRLLLHTTREALEDAAIPLSSLRGVRGGVFVGAINCDYHKLLARNSKQFDLYACVNTAASSLSGRIAHFLGLSGPASSVDAACATSLVCLQQAMRAIENGAPLAIAAAANLLFTDEYSRAYASAGMLAADGRCKTFDASADGFVRSEGIATLVLKPLEAAERDGNPIYGILRGVHVTHEAGRGDYKTPTTDGQTYLLDTCYRELALSPDSVDYVECHGTGTKAGDPVELNALANAFALARRNRPLVLGSIKANIGHTESAAGMAGTIKALMALRNEVIPPNLHFRNPTSGFDWSANRVIVPEAPFEWKSEPGQPRRAGVSAFGLSGVNAHAVFEEYAPPSTPTRKGTSAQSVRRIFFPLSNTSQEGLSKDIQEFGNHLRAGSRAEEVQRTLCFGRDALQFRAILTEKKDRPFVVAHAQAREDTKLAFVFSGQGGQWSGMGLDYLRDPVFASSFQRASEALERFVPFRVREALSSASLPTLLEDIQIVQPILFALQVAMAQTWMSKGATPAFTIGHSMGEVAAAVTSGILSIGDGAGIISLRSKWMATLRGRVTSAMLATDLSRREAEVLLHDYQGSVTIAAINAPSQLVLSGHGPALDDICGSLERRDRFARKISVEVASHSSVVEPIRDNLLRDLATLEWKAPNEQVIPIISSSMRGASAEDVRTPEYWWNNLRATVDLSDSVATAMERKVSAFVEMSAHPVLGSAIAQHATEQHPLLVLPSSSRNQRDMQCLEDGLSRLWVRGVSVKMSAFCAPHGSRARLFRSASGGRAFPIPYPSTDSESERAAKHHPVEFEFTDLGDATRFRMTMRHGARSVVEQGHVVATVPIFPGMGFVAASLEFGHRHLGFTGRLRLSHVAFVLPLETSRLDATQGRSVILVSRRVKDGAQLEFFDGERLLARCHLQEAERCSSAAPTEMLPQAIEPGGSPADATALYKDLERLGLSYQGMFRGLRSFQIEAATECHLTAEISQGAPACATLDILLQGALPLVLAAGPMNEPFLPAKIDSIEVNAIPDGGWVRILARGNSSQDESRTFDIEAQGGTFSCSIRGVSVMPFLKSQEGRWWRNTWSHFSTTTLQRSYPVCDAKRQSTLQGRGIVVEDAHADPAETRIWLMPSASVCATPSQAFADAVTLVRDLVARQDFDRLSFCFVTRESKLSLLESGFLEAWIALFRTLRAEYPSLAGAFCITRALEDYSEIAFDAQSSELSGRVFAVREGRLEEQSLASIDWVVPSREEVKLPLNAPVLITGGAGALGLVCAEELLRLGFGSLWLVNRAVPESEACAKIERLRTQFPQAEIVAYQMDIGSEKAGSELRALALKWRQRGMQSLGLLIHAAGLLEDATFTNVTPEAILRTWSPKGSALLTLLEVFGTGPAVVAFSSAAAALGSSGQASYAAANGFMDGVATHLREHLGVRATSVQWGPWKEVGLAIQSDNRGKRLESKGLFGLTNSEGARMFTDILMNTFQGTCPPVLAAMKLSKDQWADAGTRSEGDESMRAIVAGILRMAPEELEPERPLRDLGLDSLMATELRVAVERVFRVKLPLSIFLRSPSVRGLEQMIQKVREPSLE